MLEKKNESKKDQNIIILLIDWILKVNRLSNLDYRNTHEDMLSFGRPSTPNGPISFWWTSPSLFLSLCSKVLELCYLNVTSHSLAGDEAKDVAIKGSQKGIRALSMWLRLKNNICVGPYIMWALNMDQISPSSSHHLLYNSFPL